MTDRDKWEFFKRKVTWSLQNARVRNLLAGNFCKLTFFQMFCDPSISIGFYYQGLTLESVCS